MVCIDVRSPKATQFSASTPKTVRSWCVMSDEATYLCWQTMMHEACDYMYYGAATIEQTDIQQQLA
eukprot:2635540-Pleurochrysis_carterae.AAC.4